MKLIFPILISFSIILAGCAAPATGYTQTPTPPSSIQPSSTPRNMMLPTWTPLPTTPPKPTRTPRNTSTPVASLFTSSPSTPIILTRQMLLDRPTYAQSVKPANLVSLEYDPRDWTLNSFYPTSYMGYSLSSRNIYDCKLEPSVGKGAEGYEVEKYSRPIGATKFDVARVSQAGELLFANYCTGEGEDYTCYQMTPGTDHDACTQAAENILSSYKLVPNPFFGSVTTSANHWVCQDAAGTVGLCLISYSVPLNAMGFGPDGQAWAVGNNGIILHREGVQWKETSSPAIHPLYDLVITSLTSGWAVGDGAEVIKYDGSSWSEVLPYHGVGEGPGGSTQQLYAVDGTSPNDVWMVGAMKGIDGKNRPYALHWNGTDLEEVNGFPDCNCGLNAVLAVAPNDVYAVGGSDLGAMVFHWDGSEWSGDVLPGADHLYALSRANDGTIWTGGIEVARDQSDTRGALFHWDGAQWQRVATPPLTGGIYALSALPAGQIVLGGDFTALQDGLDWQPITTDIAGYGWIVDIEQDAQGNVWALTHSGNIFKLAMGK